MEELSEFYAGFDHWQARRSCPNQRFIFPTLSVGSVCGPPAVQQTDNSPTGRSACERPHRYLQPNSDVAGELAARVAHERFQISNDLVARLNALGHSRGATLFMTLLTCFKTLLLLRSGRNDICVGDHDGQSLSTREGARDRPFREHHAHPDPIDADLTFQRSARSRARRRPGGLRQAGTPVRYHCRPAGGRRRSGSSITRSILFRSPGCVSPTAQAVMTWRSDRSVIGKAGRSCRSIALGSQ